MRFKYAGASAPSLSPRKVVTVSSMEIIEIFHDPVENQDWENRGWYDGADAGGTLPLVNDGAIGGSTKSIECAFAQGADTGTNCSTFRLLFAPTDNIYIRYYVKFSTNWVGSGVSFHPHEFYFLSDIAPDFGSLGNSDLTTYVEQNGLIPRLALQDSLNIDEAQIGVDLRLTSENRAVAGCNSGPIFDDEIGGNCFLNGLTHRNTFHIDSDFPSPMLVDQWYKVEAFFKMNSISGSIGQADGIMRFWLNGVLHIDKTDAIIRTNENATMKFKQLIWAPFIGDGSPSVADQSVFYDDITLGIETGLDIIAPILTLPTGIKTSSTTGSGDVTSINDPNGVLWFVVSENGANPSAQQILDGDDQGDVAGVDSGNQPVTAAGLQPTIGFTGLSASTAYFAHYLHVDAANNQSNVESSSPAFTTDASDVTAPILTFPTGIKINSISGSGSVTTDEANGMLYAWATINASESAADIKTNSDANGNTQAVVAIGVQPTITFTSLSVSTTYFAHYVQEDIVPNQSLAVHSSPAFTTDAAGAFDGFFTDGLWTTSFDYGQECSANGADPSQTTNCADIEDDDISWNTGTLANGGNYTGCVVAANNPSGDGGMGARFWVGDGPNSGSQQIRITMEDLQNNDVQETELWIRWYIRYELGFAWVGNDPHYDKIVRLWTKGPGQPGGSLFPGYGDGGYQVAIEPGADAQSGAPLSWSDVFGTTSDGLFHRFEVHFKMDTDQTDGVIQLWIDGTLTIDLNNVDISQGNLDTRAGFHRMDWHANQNNPNNGGPMYVDYDDMAISKVVPLATDAGGNPWIGPV